MDLKAYTWKKKKKQILNQVKENKGEYKFPK